MNYKGFEKKRRGDKIFSKIIKIFVILIVNILLTLNIFIIFDWVILAAINYNLTPFQKSFLENPTEREENNLPYDSQKQPIIIGGCSYAYGSSIKEDETFSYLLQKKSHRKVYNVSFPSHGIQHMFYKLKNYSLFKNDINPEYFIYIFIEDHVRRLYVDFFDIKDNELYFNYKIKKGKLIQPSLDEKDQINFLNYIKITYLAKKLNQFFFQNQNPDSEYNLLRLYLTECKKELVKHYPLAKFVIIVYADIDDHWSVKKFHTDRWTELEKDGFIIINLDKREYKYLTKGEYVAKDSVHPSAKAWEELTPMIMKKLNIEDCENQPL